MRIDATLLPYPLPAAHTTAMSPKPTQDTRSTLEQGDESLLFAPFRFIFRCLNRIFSILFFCFRSSYKKKRTNEQSLATFKSFVCQHLKEKTYPAVHAKKWEELSTKNQNCLIRYCELILHRRNEASTSLSYTDEEVRAIAKGFMNDPFVDAHEHRLLIFNNHEDYTSAALELLLEVVTEGAERPLMQI